MGKKKGKSAGCFYDFIGLTPNMTSHRAVPFAGPALLLLLLSVSGLQAEHPDAKATFRTNAEMVLVPVTITDRNGKTVEGLRAQNFKVLDNHAPQQIVSFTNEDSPCSVVLVLDTSSSMQYTLPAAKHIAHAFLAAANPEDEFMLLTVSTLPNVISGFTSDPETLEKSVEFSRPGGLTALIDTVYLGLNQMQKARRAHRALLILSDGIDNHSRYSKSELMRVALEADVEVYTVLVDTGSADMSIDPVEFRPILVGKPWDQAQLHVGPSMLQALGGETGGILFRVRSKAESEEAVIKAGRAIRSEYLIGYQPRKPGLIGKWHQVQVKTDLPRVKIYARKGYFSEEVDTH